MLKCACCGKKTSKKWVGYCSRSCRNIAWIEKHCIVPDGRDVGKPIVLRGWQREMVVGIYDTPTRRAIISVGRKNAKALALDTPIPTPDGWKTMAEIKAGMQVYGSDGKPVSVVAESEVFTDKQCYRVGFSDGSYIVASGDHLWTTRHKFAPWKPPATYSSGKLRGNGSQCGREKVDTLTTEQIAASLNYPRGDGVVEYNHKIDASGALLSENISLPIDPYVMGAWLGDGSSYGGRFTSGEQDLEHLMTELSLGLKGNVSVVYSAARAPTISTAGLGLHVALRLLGLLANKHIPDLYLNAGTEQRWALLQGLMDTDGTVTRHAGRTTPRCSFTSNRYELARGTWRLARSLGLKATMREAVAKLNGREISKIWVVAFPADKSSKVFRLERKQTLLPEKLGRRSGTLVITSCEPVQSVPTKCIAVDSPDHLFLAGHGCVPTHNTALAAILLLLHICGPEARPNSQLYSTALSRDQAAIVYSLAAKMVRFSPLLAQFVTVRETIKELACQELGTLYKALSADAATSYGLSPVFIVHDELGQVKGPRHSLYEALETATGAQQAPLSIVISTQAPNDADLLSILIDDAIQQRKIYDLAVSGKSLDDIAEATGAHIKSVAEVMTAISEGATSPKTKLFLYTAPDGEDPFSEETIRMANPAFGDFQNAEETMEMAEAARRMPAREAEFRNLILNQRVEAYSPFVTKGVWSESGGEPQFSGLVYAGLDLSETSDLTALIMVSLKNGFFNVQSTFWLPAEGLEERARQDRVPYDMWEKQGFLQTTPGKSIEYEYVAKHIASLFNEHDIRKMAFDRYNMRHLKPWLLQAGLSESLIADRFQDFGQGFVSMSPALRNLETILLNGKMRHGNHPILTMCAANSVVKTDEAGNRKLDKKRSRGRIDGMVALAMACAVANEHQGHKQVFSVNLNSILTDARV